MTASPNDSNKEEERKDRIWSEIVVDADARQTIADWKYWDE